MEIPRSFLGQNLFQVNMKSKYWKHRLPKESDVDNNFKTFFLFYNV